jgi:hypothetical protein
MPFSLARRSTLAGTIAAMPFLLLVACTAPPKTPVAASALPPPAPVRVIPVEAEPRAPATEPASLFTLITQGPEAAMLAYADKVRPLGTADLNAELARLGDPGDAPTRQMQVALVLAQTRVPADLARALGLLQRVLANPGPDAQPLHPLARALAARYLEQRRVEDDRDRQAQQLRDSQRRMDQLNERIEALRAIERSFSRPSGAQPQPLQPPAPATNGSRPASQ